MSDDDKRYEQAQRLLAEARGKKPRFVSPIHTFGTDPRAHEPCRDLHSKELRAEFELKITKEEKVLLLWTPIDSCDLKGAVALVDNVVKRGKFVLDGSGEEFTVTVVRVGDMWFGGGGISSRRDYVCSSGWITKAICANILLESLLWLPPSEKARCWDLINPKKKYPGSRLLF